MSKNRSPRGEVRGWGLGSLLALMLMVFALPNSVLAQPDAVSIEFWNEVEDRSIIKVNHQPWQDLLDRYLNDQHPSGINRFNYDGVSEVDYLRLVDYLNYLQKLEPRQLNKNEQFAYWVNLYNAKTVEIVIRRNQDDPVGSIRAIRSGLFTPGPWERKTMEVAMQELSLDDIEHGILRPHWQDKRIHFIVNCASLGCPNLQKQVFTADNAEELMVKAEREYLSHSRGLRIEGETLYLSSIFDWYARDFADDMEGLKNYLREFVEPDQRIAFNLTTEVEYDYDWRLNRP